MAGARPPPGLTVLAPAGVTPTRPFGQYAFVTLPYAEFSAGGSITDENIGFGSLSPLPPDGLPPDLMVPGIAIFSKRSPAIAAWLTGIDLAFVKVRACAQESRVVCHGGAVRSMP